MRYVLACALASILFSVPLNVQGGSALVMGDGSIVAVVNNLEGHLQLWKTGAEKPEWTFQLTARGGLQSSVAAMALRSNGEILVVERYGRVLSINRGGRVSSQKTPAYEYIQLTVEVKDVDWSQWDQQVETVGRTAGVFVSEDAKQLYLVPNERSRTRKVSVDKVLNQPNSVVFLTDYFEFMFKDKNIMIWRKNGEHPITVGRTWTGGESVYHPTALAVCKGWLIIGTEKGVVNFIPETGDPTSERFRQVSNQDKTYRSILDAGCLGPNLAYTVSEDASNQIQIWDLDTRAAVSWVGADHLGHPGVALAGVAAKSGAQLLSLGDFDVRLWSIENKKLKLISKYYPETRKQIFAGVALLSGDFIVWDGVRFWKIPRNGGPAVYYAGKKVEAMVACSSDTTDEIKCWSVARPQ